jgi:hypothetical protein
MLTYAVLLHTVHYEQIDHMPSRTREYHLTCSITGQTRSIDGELCLTNAHDIELRVTQLTNVMISLHCRSTTNLRVRLPSISFEFVRSFCAKSEPMATQTVVDVDVVNEHHV